jgi:hypothetical protein
MVSIYTYTTAILKYLIAQQLVPRVLHLRTVPHIAFIMCILEVYIAVLIRAVPVVAHLHALLCCNVCVHMFICYTEQYAHVLYERQERRSSECMLS